MKIETIQPRYILIKPHLIHLCSGCFMLNSFPDNLLQFFNWSQGVYIVVMPRTIIT